MLSQEDEIHWDELGQRWSFQVPGLSERRLFRVSVSKAGGDKDAAERIARQCYVYLQNGADFYSASAYAEQLFDALSKTQVEPVIVPEDLESRPQPSSRKRTVPRVADSGPVHRRRSQAPPPWQSVTDLRVAVPTRRVPGYMRGANSFAVPPHGSGIEASLHPPFSEILCSPRALRPVALSGLSEPVQGQHPQLEQVEAQPTLAPALLEQPMPITALIPGPASRGVVQPRTPPTLGAQPRTPPFTPRGQPGTPPFRPSAQPGTPPSRPLGQPGTPPLLRAMNELPEAEPLPMSPEPAEPIHVDPKKEKAEKEDKDKKERKKKKDMCIRIQGRDGTRTHAEINGLFVLRKAKIFHGAQTYEQVGGKLKLYYWSPELRWRISLKMDNHFPVLAFAPVQNRGKTPPGEGLEWFVAEGEQHILDPDVKSTEEDAPQKEEKEKKRKSGATKEDGRKPEEILRERLLEMLAVAQELQVKQQDEDVMMVTGRDLGKKNSSINGIYVARPGLYHGVRAWEKLGSGARKFLFWSATVYAWKISDRLQDQKKGFAYAKAIKEDEVRSPEALSKLKWKVFDGSSYSKDTEVKCCPLDVGALQAELEKLPEAESPPPTKRQKRAQELNLPEDLLSSEESLSSSDSEDRRNSPSAQPSRREAAPRPTTRAPNSPRPPVAPPTPKAATTPLPSQGAQPSKVPRSPASPAPRPSQPPGPLRKAPVDMRQSGSPGRPQASGTPQPAAQAASPQVRLRPHGSKTPETAPLLVPRHPQVPRSPFPRKTAVPRERAVVTVQSLEECSFLKNLTSAHAVPKPPGPVEVTSHLEAQQPQPKQHSGPLPKAPPRLPVSLFKLQRRNALRKQPMAAEVPKAAPPGVPAPLPLSAKAPGLPPAASPPATPEVAACIADLVQGFSADPLRS